MYAFWFYNCFPYMLGANVVTMGRDSFKVENYGSFQRHAGIVLVPGEVGQEVQKELGRLTLEHQRAVQALNDEFMRRRDALLARFEVAAPSPKREDR